MDMHTHTHIHTHAYIHKYAYMREYIYIYIQSDGIVKTNHFIKKIINDDDSWLRSIILYIESIFQKANHGTMNDTLKSIWLIKIHNFCSISIKKIMYAAWPTQGSSNSFKSFWAQRLKMALPSLILITTVSHNTDSWQLSRKLSRDSPSCWTRRSNLRLPITTFAVPWASKYIALLVPLMTVIFHITQSRFKTVLRMSSLRHALIWCFQAFCLTGKITMIQPKSSLKREGFAHISGH